MILMALLSSLRYFSVPGGDREKATDRYSRLCDVDDISLIDLLIEKLFDLLSQFFPVG
jgi:hypothetical protein